MKLLKSLYICSILCLPLFFIGCGWREEITINIPPICKILDGNRHKNCTQPCENFDPKDNFSEVPIEEGRSVIINLKVWLRWSGDDGLFGQCPAIQPDTKKISMYPGEIYSVVHFSGAKPLEGVQYEEAIERYGGSERTVIDTTVYSGSPVDNLTVTVGVYDQDQLAATQRDKISKFLDDAGKQAAAVYPPAAEVIPFIVPILKLVFLDLPNIFLKDDRLIPPSTWVIRKCKKKVDNQVKDVWRVEPSVRDFDYGIVQIELKGCQ